MLLNSAPPRTGLKCLRLKQKEEVMSNDLIGALLQFARLVVFVLEVLHEQQR